MTEGATDPEKKPPVKGKSLFFYANSRVEEYEESDGAESDDEYGEKVDWERVNTPQSAK